MNSIKQVNNKLNNKFVKGFNNILSPTLLNLFIVLSLIIILFLVYMKYKKIELFDYTTQPQVTQVTQTPIVTIGNNGYIKNLLNSYTTNIKNKVAYQNQLNIQEKTIQTLAQQVNDTLNAI